jgi:hypothetical protein
LETDSRWRSVFQQAVASPMMRRCGFPPHAAVPAESRGNEEEGQGMAALWILIAFIFDVGLMCALSYTEEEG